MSDCVKVWESIYIGQQRSLGSAHRNLKAEDCGSTRWDPILDKQHTHADLACNNWLRYPMLSSAMMSYPISLQPHSALQATSRICCNGCAQQTSARGAKGNAAQSSFTGFGSGACGHALWGAAATHKTPGSAIFEAGPCKVQQPCWWPRWWLGCFFHWSCRGPFHFAWNDLATPNQRWPHDKRNCAKVVKFHGDDFNVVQARWLHWVLGRLQRRVSLRSHQWNRGWETFGWSVAPRDRRWSGGMAGQQPAAPIAVLQGRWCSQLEQPAMKASMPKWTAGSSKHKACTKPPWRSSSASSLCRSCFHTTPRCIHQQQRSCPAAKFWPEGLAKAYGPRKAGLPGQHAACKKPTCQWESTRQKDAARVKEFVAKRPASKMKRPCAKHKTPFNLTRSQGIRRAGVHSCKALQVAVRTSMRLKKVASSLRVCLHDTYLIVCLQPEHGLTFWSGRETREFFNYIFEWIVQSLLRRYLAPR